MGVGVHRVGKVAKKGGADAFTPSEGVGDQFVNMECFPVRRCIDKQIAEQFALFVPYVTVVIIDIDCFIEDIGRRDQQGIDVEEGGLSNRFFVFGGQAFYVRRLNRFPFHNLDGTYG